MASRSAVTRATPASPYRARWACGWGLALACVPGLGCGTTRVTDTPRTATEQLLISDAIDRSVSRMDFRVLAGKPVYFDAQFLQGSIDHGYVASSLRQHLLACGCLLQENRSQATYVVEARAGGVGTDRHQILVGVPEMNLPGLLPGQPSLIPEIPLAKKTDQKGVAKLAVFAYNRLTGRPVWQSGAVQTASTSKDTWVLGAGPFRRGTIGEDTEIAGQQIAIPFLSGKEDGGEKVPVLTVTQAAAWQEEPAGLAPVPYRSGPPDRGSPAQGPVPPAGQAAGGADPKGAAAPGQAGAQTVPDPRLEPLRFPGARPEGAADPGRAGTGTSPAGPFSALPPGNRKPFSFLNWGSDPSR